MNIGTLIERKMQEYICSFNIEKWIPCVSPMLEGGFTIFVENGTAPDAIIRILDDETQQYYKARLVRCDEEGIEFEIIDLEGK